MTEGTVVTQTVTLRQMVCGGCYITFAVPDHLYTNARDKGESFRCPNPECKWPSQSYVESENQKLAKKLEKERQRADSEASNAKFWHERRETAEAEREKEVKRRKRAEKRAAGGACPCCNRTFAATKMALHMKSKHPEFAKESA